MPQGVQVLNTQHTASPTGLEKWLKEKKVINVGIVRRISGDFQLMVVPMELEYRTYFKQFIFSPGPSAKEANVSPEGLFLAGYFKPSGGWGL